MKKSFVILAVSITVGIGSIFGGVVEAESISSLKDQQSKIQSEQSELKSDINDANQKINSLEGQKADVQTEIKRIDLAIGDTHQKLNQKTTEVEETKTDIAKLKEEIKVTKERIDKRNELLKDRARNYQLTGGLVSYIDVLMGSENFSDFIDRANAVATIMRADQDILKQHEIDKQDLENNQAKVEEELASLQTMLDELEKMNKQLNSQRAEKDSLLSTLDLQVSEEHTHKLTLEEEQQILAAQDAAIQKAITLENERIAAEKAAAAATGNTSESGGTVTAPVSSGGFIQPANGIFTSGFGSRPEFSPGIHYGVDIANRAPNVPIWAAADGVVVTAAHTGQALGNYIIIAHSINGAVYATLYAHMKTLNVGNGAVVKQGQQIGIMGTTGNSTGVHLHFELYKGGYNGYGVNAINPRGIVPLP
ncbi:peptidoglycan DD-metalloendopeptidase family protein [Neobacillus sp. FSL H8-0543]|uniref:murein hydrolase activator EnvC family protein n=1 Tax=Neobacillus sp. FSL H8-0543 TaxID=2954672 RepID=UPI003158313E